ncbi:glyoxalase [Caldimonas brevitalea]|uniref:Glyoxalase n=1 Tax=Caldimonas brevitalea TaxID=413882 RepID=A0A0G3BV92_9BURK|nr:glyoxalase [Caldimonas brevitalea]
MSPEAVLDFYHALGFETTYRMTQPYLYMVFKLGGFQLHFGRAPKGLDPHEEHSGCCLVIVDAVASYHRSFSGALRARYGKVPSRGLPRITRFRTGQSRFTVIDPSGNSLIFIQRDEPAHLDYGGSDTLTGLAKAIDNARILCNFRNDDRAAAKVLDTALRKHWGEASVQDKVRALAARVDIAIAMEDVQQCRQLHGRLQEIDLLDEVREKLRAELEILDGLTQWLSKAAAG